MATRHAIVDVSGVLQEVSGSDTLYPNDYPVMVGDSGSGGTRGAVPAPASGDAAAGKFLKADATWAVPSGGGSSSPTQQNSTASGTQDDFSLSASFTYLRMNNSSAVSFTGFTVGGSAPSGGDRVIIDNIGTSTVRVTNGAIEPGSSTSTSLLTTESNRGQVIGQYGRMILIYDGTASVWRATLISTGKGINVAYASGNFTGNGSITWTVESGDQQSFFYKQQGTELTVSFYLSGTSVSGSGNQLLVALPGSFTIDGNQTFPITAADAGTNTPAYTFMADTGTSLACARVDVANWGSSTNQTTVAATLLIKVL